MFTLFGRGIGIHTNNWRITAKQKLELIFYTLCSHTICTHITAAAVWTFAGRIRIRMLRPLSATTMTDQRMRALMVRERRRAMRTLGHTATLTAHQKICKSTPIEKQNAFLATLCCFLKRKSKSCREDRSASVFELGSHINYLDLREHRHSRSLGHGDARPVSITPASLSCSVEALERWCCRAKHQRGSTQASHLSSNFSCVIARKRILLVRGLVLLVNDVKPRVLDRCKQGRTCAYYHASSTLPNQIPLVKALTE